jgi:hypothetical protein
MELFIYNSFSTTTTQQQQPMESISTSTNENSDIIIRIINDYEFYKQGEKFITGWEYVQELYFTALRNSHKWTQDDLYNYFENSVWPKLIGHKIYSSNIYIIDNITLSKDIEKYFYEWLDLAKLDQCCLKNLNRSDKFCILKIKIHKVGRQMGLPLYEMQARFIEMYTEGGLSMWSGHYVATFLCHTKNCMVCTIKETRAKNLHRNYCVAFSLVDNRLIHSCVHEPKCRDFGSSAFHNDK